jgi:predicted transcriptional regulator
MDFTWVFPKQQKDIIKKLYEQHKKNEGNEDKEFYYETSLAKALEKQKQAVFKPLRTLIERGIVTVVKVGPGPDKGQVRYLDLTDNGIAIWKFLATPTVDEIKQVIIKIKDYSWDYVDLSELAYKVAIELGKDPEDGAIRKLIYAVMARPDVKRHLKRRQVIDVSSK